jgi:hypothetical protein
MCNLDLQIDALSFMYVEKLVEGQKCGVEAD